LINYRLFDKIICNKVGNEIGNTSPATRKHGLNATRKQILSEMRHNPNITKAELEIIIGISDTAIDNNIRYLKNNGYLERIGSNKDGYWKVLNKLELIEVINS